MDVTISTLIERLRDPSIESTNVIRWGCPVPCFGDVSSSTVATVGLNPSNREFVDDAGNELDGTSRRFHTLNSLGLSCWSEARAEHAELISESCRGYFARNPYDRWFRQLEHVISGTHASYYGASSGACHLDLIPYATACKWTGLTRAQRVTLLRIAGDALGTLLQRSSIRVLILNGTSVVDQFQSLADIRLNKREMPEWALNRRTTAVNGLAYTGAVRTVAGVKLARDIAVLGFNHNIQSSFGVTNQVKSAIRDWISRAIVRDGR